MTSKWAIMLSGEDVWFEDGKPERFNSEEEAIKALQEEIEVCEDAVKMGWMEDYDFDDHRIVEILE
jgi:hypothetical protein